MRGDMDVDAQESDSDADEEDEGDQDEDGDGTSAHCALIHPAAALRALAGRAIFKAISTQC